MKVESPTTVMTSSEDRVTANKNDNSNPQQGSEAMVASSGLTNTAMMKAPFSAQNGATTKGGHNRPNGLKSPPTKRDSRKLFVGGLPSDVTEEEFRTFFEQFGEIVDSVVMFDRETNRSRGFGFVTYQDEEVSNFLLSKNEVGDDVSNKQATDANGVRVGRLVMRGKTCEVKAAEPKEMAKPNRRTHQTHGAGNNGNRGSSMDRRLMNKMYNPAEGHPMAATHYGAYDPNMHNYAPGHYSMQAAMAMGYYHPHHMTMYDGYMQPMYAPTQPMHPSQADGSYAGIVASHMDGPNPGMYAEGQDSIHAHPYYHPQMMPPHQAQYAHPNHHNPAYGSSNNSTNATTSVMQPATPGIPPKKEGTESTA